MRVETIGRHTLYLGDCHEVLSGLLPPVIACVITDPPYGIGSWNATGGNSLRPEEAEAANRWDIVPDAELLALVVASAPRYVMWGGNHFAHLLGPCHSPLVWDKAYRGMHLADGEMAWTNFDFGTLRILNLPRASCGMTGNRVHPTQKPVGVMVWSIEQAKVPEGGTVLDPFLGSGTTLVACEQLGMAGIGIEIDEGYFNIACSRIEKAVAQGRLDFEDARPTAPEAQLLPLD
jgi:DNA modification methylase